MSRQSVVLTSVGRDRVGIVGEIAQVLYELNCNLLDSSMTLLRGEFALILMVDLPPDLTAELLKDKLEPTEDKLNMAIHVRSLSDDEMAEPTEDQNGFIISVYGADRTGIVAGITSALAENSINITDVQTKSAGKSGDRSIFIMLLEVTAGAGMSERDLLTLLEPVAKKLDVDVTVQTLEAAEL